MNAARVRKSDRFDGDENATYALGGAVEGRRGELKGRSDFDDTRVSDFQTIVN